MASAKVPGGSGCSLEKMQWRAAVDLSTADDKLYRLLLFILCSYLHMQIRVQMRVHKYN